MKILIAGASGHFSYVTDMMENRDRFEISGTAPGVKGEDMSPLISVLEKRKHGPRYDRFSDALKECRPDAVVINTWYGRGYPLIREAVRRDIPVFAEKPLAGSIQELDDLSALLSRHPVPVSCMFGLRFTSPFRTLRRVIREGRIGEIRLISAQKSYKLGNRPAFFNTREESSGLIPWVGSHGIDWIHWVSGLAFRKISATHSFRGNPGGGEMEMTAAASFLLENEVPAALTLDYLRPGSAPTHGDDRLRAAGTKGIVEVTGNRVLLTDREGERYVSPEPAESVFLHFLDALEGKANDSVSTADSLYVSRIALMTREAADRNRSLYPEPRKNKAEELIYEQPD